MKLHIEKPVYGGSGLARADGKAVFVPLTLPGETVDAEIVQDKGGFANAELRAVSEPSAARIEPPCPFYGRCGGCHYQHAAYAAQVEMKLAILRESLERARLREIPPIAPITAGSFGYRNRIRLHVQADPFSLCYKRMNSHRDLPVDTCPIAAPVLQRTIQEINRQGPRLQLPAYVSEVELFTDGGETTLMLSLWTDRDAAGAGQLCEKTVALLRPIIPELSGVGAFAAQEGSATNRLLASKGSAALLYSAADQTYRVSFGSFFQVNRFLVDALTKLVAAGEAGATLWDLYAGVGLFSVPLAASFGEVTAVESSPFAVRDLRENLRGVRHRIVASDSASFLRQAVRQRLPAPDLLIVDPPRAGLGRDVTTALGKIQPRKITYVSCDPATLSRDLAMLVESGYRLLRMHLLDLFPQTFHLESVVHLSLD